MLVSAASGLGLELNHLREGRIRRGHCGEVQAVQEWNGEEEDQRASDRQEMSLSS